MHNHSTIRTHRKITNAKLVIEHRYPKIASFSPIGSPTVFYLDVTVAPVLTEPHHHDCVVELDRLNGVAA